MNKILYRSEHFVLKEMHHRKDNKKKIHYVIMSTSDWINNGMMDEIRDIVDPLRNKSGKHGTQWRFRKKEEAEKMFSILVLKWS